MWILNLLYYIYIVKYWESRSPALAFIIRNRYHQAAGTWHLYSKHSSALESCRARTYRATNRFNLDEESVAARAVPSWANVKYIFIHPYIYIFQLYLFTFSLLFSFHYNNRFKFTLTNYFMFIYTDYPSIKHLRPSTNHFSGKLC